MSECNTCGNETPYYNFPLGRTVTAAELQNYMNNLLCTVDRKIHDVALLTSQPEDKEKNRIICELNHLRCDVMAIRTELQKFGVEVRCNNNAVGEIRLDVLKLKEKANILFANVEELTGVTDNLKELIDTRKDELKEYIDNELSDRDEIFDTEVERIDTELAEEKQTREVADTMLSQRIETVEQTMEDIKEDNEEINGQFETITTRQEELFKNIQDEVTERIAAQNATNKRITTVAEGMDSLVEQSAEELRGEFTQQLEAVSTELSSDIGELTATHADDIEALQNKDDELQAAIDAEAVTRTQSDTSLSLRIDEINGNINDFNDTATEALATANEAKTVVTELSSTVEQFTQDTTDTVDAFKDEVKITVGEITKEHIEIKNNVENNTSNIESNEMRIESLEDSDNNFSTLLNREVTNREQGDSEINGKITSINTKLGELTQDIQNVELDTEGYNQKFAELRNRVDDITAKANEVKEDLQAHIESYVENFSDLNIKVANNEMNITLNKRNIDGLTSSINNLTSKISKLFNKTEEEQISGINYYKVVSDSIKNFSSDEERSLITLTISGDITISSDNRPNSLDPKYINYIALSEYIFGIGISNNGECFYAYKGSDGFPVFPGFVASTSDFLNAIYLIIVSNTSVR